MTLTAEHHPATEQVAEKKPRSLVAGVQLGRALSGLAALALVAGVVALSIRRYQVDNTRLNFAGPAFGFCMLVLLAFAGAAVYAVRAATRTLHDDTGARDTLFGMGAAASVLLLILAIVLFGNGAALAGVIAIAWLALTVVSLALMSTRAASVWLEGQAPALNVLAWIRGNLIAFIGALVMAYLYIPIFVVVAMSFNHEVGKPPPTSGTASRSTTGRTCARRRGCAARSSPASGSARSRP